MEITLSTFKFKFFLIVLFIMKICAYFLIVIKNFAYIIIMMKYIFEYRMGKIEFKK